MDSFIVDWSLATIFALLKMVIKNQQKKAAWRKAMLKLRDAIDLAYGEDVAFDVSAARLQRLKTAKEGKVEAA